MATPEHPSPEFGRRVRQLFLGFVLVLLLALVLFWRIDNPRAEQLRLRVVDLVVPQMERLLTPVGRLSHIVEDFQSYAQLYEQNRELRRELQQMKAWRETAIQLDQENARLQHLNNVRLGPNLSYVTSEVLVDSGGPFQQSVLINIGSDDNVRDGWAAMDGLGLVGRVSGVGRKTARVILLTDRNSWIPVKVQPSNSRVMMAGDNSGLPQLRFLQNAADVEPGDRVITSGDGNVFPAELLVGRVVIDSTGQFRVRPSADFRNLDFLRLVQAFPSPPIPNQGDLVAKAIDPPDPAIPADPATSADSTPSDASGGSE
ncbi:MAG: rod shape-determining protein MreC [Paracoccaceae bacterium]|nr:rod shape-determining protein MreC [Paracoccaceae bacterium]MDE2915112.1 rod shape-determining protein MreC [Paracoccaceae bacterium]